MNETKASLLRSINVIKLSQTDREKREDTNYKYQVYEEEETSLLIPQTLKIHNNRMLTLCQ